MRNVLVAVVAALSLSPAEAQPPTSLEAGTIYVEITNNYDVTLAAMGLPGVHRIGHDDAKGLLTRDGDTFRGILSAHAAGSMDARSLLGNCSDHSDGTQEIYAVAHIERPSAGLVQTDSLIAGSVGDFDLNFFFFPESAPDFAEEGRCQGRIGFDGYGPLFGSDGEYNEAPYPWLPQTRPPGEFLPFNDTRWTTQNGLLLHVPPAGEDLSYQDNSQRLPGQNVNWIIWVSHGPQ